MSEHLQPLIAAYVAQRQRDFHRNTRGISTPENRAVWEFDASEKIRAHDRELKAEAWDEGVSALLAAHRWNNAEPWLHLQDNPYRIESQGGESDE